MQIIRGDDYQSWVYSHGAEMVVVDPWLTNAQEFPVFKWLLYRPSTEPSYLQRHNLVSQVNYIIITAHFSDHLDLASLSQFDSSIPIYTTKEAKRTLIANGFLNVIVVKSDHEYQLGKFTLEVFNAGKPYNTTTFSYKLTAGDSNVFHEPHMLDPKLSFDSLDACILTVDQVKVLGLIQVSMSEFEAEKAKARLNANYLLATGVYPSRSKGLISRILSIVESSNALNSVSVICKNPGDSLTI